MIFLFKKKKFKKINLLKSSVTKAEMFESFKAIKLKKNK